VSEDRWSSLAADQCRDVCLYTVYTNAHNTSVLPQHGAKTLFFLAIIYRQRSEVALASERAAALEEPTRLRSYETPGVQGVFCQAQPCFAVRASRGHHPLPAQHDALREGGPIVGY
jgi:hypothetical protein